MRKYHFKNILPVDEGRFAGRVVAYQQDGDLFARSQQVETDFLSDPDEPLKNHIK